MHDGHCQKQDNHFPAQLHLFAQRFGVEVVAKTGGIIGKVTYAYDFDKQIENGRADHSLVAEVAENRNHLSYRLKQQGKQQNAGNHGDY